MLDLYLEKIPIGLKIKILTNKPQDNFVTVAQKFKIKPKVDFEVRKNKDCHDRLFFVDNACWIIGQSIKDAGKKPTYLVKIVAYDLFRNIFDDYIKFIEDYNLEYAEVSDGSMYMPHDQKLDYIQKLSKHVTVLSEVGSKQKGVVISTDQWINMMKSELEKRQRTEEGKAELELLEKDIVDLEKQITKTKIKKAPKSK